MTSEAVSFIKRVTAEHKIQAMVSFSGGKDSLATLLLTLEAGMSLPVLFLDTGLEFPETVEHVKEVADRHGLRLIIEKAPEGAFKEGLETFGPPGRDYRWCCKTNKLGPTVQAIMKNFPSGVLSFIGQRRYESEARSSKPRVWNNPWTPGQIGASPIQHWTALHIWLYIMSKNEPSNPWYQRGLDRIGCSLCPACDMAEVRLVERTSPQLQEWRAYLLGYAAKRGLPEEWVDYGAWRWRAPPQSFRQELERIKIDIKPLGTDDGESKPKNLRLFLQQGASPCTLGFSIEGAFSHSLHLDRVANVLNMLGPVELNIEEGWCSMSDITVFDSGALMAKGQDVQSIKEKVERVRRAAVKAEECVGCGVCIARCSEGALSLELGRIQIKVGKCAHCGRCLEPCPAITFGDSAFDF
jgi:phosphoadenosine phosphosulfate reductase